VTSRFPQKLRAVFTSEIVAKRWVLRRISMLLPVPCWRAALAAVCTPLLCMHHHRDAIVVVV
jgi:hypothetical protein